MKSLNFPFELLQEALLICCWRVSGQLDAGCPPMCETIPLCQTQSIILDRLAQEVESGRGRFSPPLENEKLLRNTAANSTYPFLFKGYF